MIAWSNLTLGECLREDTLNFLKGSNFMQSKSSRRSLARGGACHRKGPGSFLSPLKKVPAPFCGARGGSSFSEFGRVAKRKNYRDR
jgi:hypothetical protein